MNFDIIVNDSLISVWNELLIGINPNRGQHKASDFSLDVSKVLSGS